MSDPAAGRGIPGPRGKTAAYLENINIGMLGTIRADWQSLLEVDLQVGQKELRALIDSGADRSYIAQHAIHTTGLKTYTAGRNLQLTLGDGSTTTVQHLVTRNTTLRINDLRCTVNLQVIPMSQFDLILGMDWLNRFRPKIDWETKEVSIKDQYETVHTFVANAKRGETPRCATITAKLAREYLKQAGAEGYVCVVKSRENPHPLIDVGGATPEETASLRDLYEEFATLFPAKLPDTPPQPREVVHDIDIIPGSRPVNLPAIPVALSRREEMQQQIQELIRTRRLIPSDSAWGAPVFFVKKKDGSLRMVCDWRGLNHITIKSPNLIPNINELFSQLRGSAVFSKIDLHQGYAQVAMNPAHQHLTAINTCFGKFEFTVMGFGLTGAPSTFMRMMTKVLAPFNTFCTVYLDDVLIHSRNMQEHMEHLRLVFEALVTAGLFAKPEKCQLGVQEIEFLGRLVSHDHIRVDPSKVALVTDWPRPECRRDVQRFLGLVNWFSQHIRGIAATAAPLSSLTGESSKFTWTTECEDAFTNLKAALAAATVLTLPDPTRPFILVTDASKNAVSGILMQKSITVPGQNDVVAYVSHKLADEESRWPAHELELFAIVYSVRKLEFYIAGSPLVVLSDHRPLEALYTQAKLSPKQARWLETLASVPLSIQYLQGGDNEAADALSRASHVTSDPEAAQLYAVVTRAAARAAHDAGQTSALATPKVSPANAPLTDEDMSPEREGMTTLTKLAAAKNCTRNSPPAKNCIEANNLTEIGSGIGREKAVIPGKEENCSADVWLDSVRAATSKDLWAGKIISRLKNQPNLASYPATAYRTVEGLLYTVGLAQRLYIPDDRELRFRLLDAAHAGPLAAHRKSDSTAELLQRDFFWPTLGKDVSQFINQCLTCQLTSSGGARPRGPMQPRNQGLSPAHPFEEVSLDWADMPLSKQGHDCVLVVMCCKIRFMVLIATNKSAGAEVFAKQFAQFVGFPHGWPRVITSDRDPRLTAAFTKEVMRVMGTRQALTVAGRAQGDGLSERAIQSLKAMLRATISDHDQADWEDRLPAAASVFNNAESSTSGYSPMLLYTGFHPRTPFNWWREAPAVDATAPPVVEEFIRRQYLMWQACDDEVRGQQAMQAAEYNKRANPVNIQVGDRVLVAATALMSIATRARPKPALGNRFTGPFLVLEKIGDADFKLMLPAQYKGHPTFNVDSLKKFIPDTFTQRVSPSPPDPIETEDGIELTVAKILAQRRIRGEDQFLTAYAGEDEADASWQPRRNFVDSNGVTTQALVEFELLHPDAGTGRGGVSV